MESQLLEPHFETLHFYNMDRNNTDACAIECGKNQQRCFWKVERSNTDPSRMWTEATDASRMWKEEMQMLQE